MATLCCLDDTYNIDILQAHYGTTGEYIMASLIQDAILCGTEKPASLQRVIRRKQRKQKVKFRLDIDIVRDDFVIDPVRLLRV